MIFSRRKLDYSKKEDNGPIHLTADGFARLKEKLARIKQRLPALAEEARRTAAYGDRSENAEYKEAKGSLRRATWQILSIEDQIKRVVVIKSGPNVSGRVEIGSTVVLEVNEKDGSTSSPRAGVRKTFEILGPHETDPAHGRISYESPLGATLMGHLKGDAITIQTRNGSNAYRIIEIR
jgi:transcription elongation factor GreA